jgi:tetratricopeptide (TPR) repeat protein
VIDAEFREFAGFDRGERETNTLDDGVLRKDRIFSRLAALACDSPMILEKMECTLPRWKKEEKSEAMAAIAGYILYCRGDYDGASEEFMEAVTCNPANLDNWMDLAFALHHLEDSLGYAILFNYDEFVKRYCAARYDACSRGLLSEIFKEIKAQGLDLGARCREFLPRP